MGWGRGPEGYLVHWLNSHTAVTAADTGLWPGQHYATPGGAWIKGKMGHLPFACQAANATLQADLSLGSSARDPSHEQQVLP